MQNAFQCLNYELTKILVKTDNFCGNIHTLQCNNLFAWCFLLNYYYFYFRIKVEYGEDGSLESRLYLSGAGRGDTGRYSCHIPGLQKVKPAIINLHITQGKLYNIK